MHFRKNIRMTKKNTTESSLPVSSDLASAPLRLLPKLRLTRETLRRLTTLDLEGVAGGEGATMPNTPQSDAVDCSRPHSD